MMANTKKSLLRFVLFGGVLTLTLTGCGDGNYDTYEECRLKELDKLTRAGKELIPEAINVISDYCSDLEAKKNEEKESKKQEPAKIIADPNWTMVNTEKGKSRGEQYLVDTNNIETDGFHNTLWVRKLDVGQTIEGKTFTQDRITLDCSAATITVLSSSNYKNGKSEENTVGRVSNTIVPGSVGADIYQYICEKK